MGSGSKQSAPAPVAPTFTDPVNGMTFTNPNAGDKDANGNPMASGASQLNAEIQQRQAAAQAATDAANAQIAQQNAANEATYQGQIGSAKTTATNTINDYFKSRGVDPNNYSSQIANLINTEAGNIVDPGTYQGSAGSTGSTTTSGGSTTTSAATPNSLVNYAGYDPNSVFSATAGSDLFNQLQSGQQTTNTANYNSIFGTGYSQNALSDSLIDPAVNSVLKAQFDPLSADLTNAQKRGTLNDVGYQAALNALNTDKSNATASVSKLAENVLSGDRSSLDTYIGGGRTAAGATTLGQTFDPTSYETGANATVKRDVANFGGDVSNAVGNTSYGDLTSLLNAGGAVQGQNDPTAANPTGAVGAGGVAVGAGDLSPQYIAQQAVAKQQRGLGTTGAF